MPRVPIAVLTAAFLFNVGQGVLRPSMPLYLQRAFGASYQMVTLIPVVFGAGKWAASLPTGYLLDSLGRPLMIVGLLLIALIDVASVSTSSFPAFCGWRALGGVGWAMFATVATTAVVNPPAGRGRGRMVSLLLMSETCGLLIGSGAGGWFYQRAGAAIPFLFEAGCMIVATAAVGRWAAVVSEPAASPPPLHPRRALAEILRTPGAVLMGVISAVLIAIQTGTLAFLFPLYLVTRAAAAPEIVGFVVSLSVLGRLAALWFGGALSDRWGCLRVLTPGLLAYAALLGSMVLLTQPAILGVWSFAIGAAAGLVAAVPTALLSDLVRRDLHGVAIGWLRTMTDGGQIIGPLLMGFLADAIDLSAPFLFGAALLIAAAWQCWRQARVMSAGGTNQETRAGEGL